MSSEMMETWGHTSVCLTYGSENVSKVQTLLEAGSLILSIFRLTDS